MPVLEDEPVSRESRSPAAAAAESDALVDLHDQPLAGKTTPLFHRHGVVIGTAVVAVLAIIYVATIFFHNLTHESTDDAFIDAHIVSIAPKIAGQNFGGEGERQPAGEERRGPARDRSAAISRRWLRKSAPRSRSRRRSLKMREMSAEQAKAHVHTLLAAYASVQGEHRRGSGRHCKMSGATSARNQRPGRERRDFEAGFPAFGERHDLFRGDA